MQIIEAGKWVERVGSKSDYTTGRQGEVVELNGPRARVYWTHHRGDKLPPKECKRTWVRFTALNLINPIV